MHRVGIESDQLVYDYLSRVGDLAQQQQLSSGARMRLVSALRGEIDRQRGAEGADSPATVRRIIGRLGSPDELVAAAAESADGTVPLPSARTGAGAGERQRRASLPRPRGGLLRKEPKEPKEPKERRGPKEPAPGVGDGREARAFRKPKAGFGRGASPRDPEGGSGGAPGGAPGGASHRAAHRAPGGAFDGVPYRAPGGASDRAFDRASGARSAAVPRPADAPDDLPADDGVPVRDWPDPSAPHMLGQDQQADADGATDWWRLEPGPFDEGTAIPGFFGGIEAPELLRRRPGSVEKDEKGERCGKNEKDGQDAEGGADEPDGRAGAEGETGTAARRRALRLLKLRRRKAAVAAEPEAPAAASGPRGGFAHPLLLLAAVLLVAGVVTGSWLPLAGGWLIAYSSRTLSRTEAKWAVLGLPGVVAAGALAWVWGRMEGRWGEPIREGAMRDVLSETWPVVVRVAAVASALYLVWRARRRTG
ncbi:hypothetical protein PZ61_0215410 [Streptomyces sp. MNU77]|uniref:hypothetical protein n=1 Tax=Streptomyces sp. MNU77 TaxID=1573406 RepID=UPI00094BB2E4|nr:hypothetical protein [Streptomyces sp. MNU77]OLO31793.1 hypothetical protein PZ61_0215410 [Streptomyces sp. MNU77]